MIGGQVLDTSALRAWCREASILVQALVWSSVEEDVVVLIPASVLAETAAQLTGRQQAVLDVLLDLHITVVDPLSGEQARTIASGEQLDIAHTISCARERGWPVVTAHPDTYTVYGIDTVPL